MKKTLALLLALLMLTPAAVSCGNAAVETTADTAPAEETIPAETTAVDDNNKEKES